MKLTILLSLLPLLTSISAAPTEPQAAQIGPAITTPFQPSSADIQYSHSKVHTYGKRLYKETYYVDLFDKNFMWVMIEDDKNGTVKVSTRWEHRAMLASGGPSVSSAAATRVSVSTSAVSSSSSKAVSSSVAKSSVSSSVPKPASSSVSVIASKAASSSSAPKPSVSSASASKAASVSVAASGSVAAPRPSSASSKPPTVSSASVSKAVVSSSSVSKAAVSSSVSKAAVSSSVSKAAVSSSVSKAAVSSSSVSKVAAVSSSAPKSSSASSASKPAVSSSASKAAAVSSSSSAPKSSATSSSASKASVVSSSSSAPKSSSTSKVAAISTTSSSIVPAASASASAAVGVSAADQAKFLTLHNEFRAKYSAGAVVWDDALANFALKTAQTCKYGHTGGPYGENIAAGVGGGYNIDKAFGSWANEDALYNFSKPGYSSATGHFTQIVWKNTGKIGCASASCADGTIFTGYRANSTYVVCEYQAPGNVVSNDPARTAQIFTANVGPKV